MKGNFSLTTSSSVLARKERRWRKGSSREWGGGILTEMWWFSKENDIAL